MSDKKHSHIFTVRVVYKSGYTHEFDVYEFESTGNGFKWRAADDTNKPLLIGVDEIAAVWQTGVRLND